MASSKVSSVKYCGVAACLPKKVLKISDYEYFDEAKAAIFSKQTGIIERRHADNGITASDMCKAAAENLLADLKWEKSEISALIFVSQSQDYTLPATACILQDRLGLPKSCAAFDISLGCSGYVYGLAVASSLISAMRLGKVLLLAGENALMNQHPMNTTAYPLFGDSGTATALAFDESAPDIFFDLCTDGAGYRHIIREYGGVRNPIESADAFDFVDVSGGAKRRKIDVHMDGAAIMDFCLREVKPSVNRVLGLAGMTAENIDFLVAHQANKLINETVRKMCKIPAEKCPYTIHKFGNTSVSSIPLTLASECADAVKSKPVTNLFAGFGVGLSWGAAIVKTDKISCPPLTEI